MSSPNLRDFHAAEESPRRKQGRCGIYHVYQSDEDGCSPLPSDFSDISCNGVLLQTPPLISVQSAPESSPVITPKRVSPKKRRAPQPPVARSSEFLTPVMVRKRDTDSFRRHSHEDLRRYEDDSSKTSLSVNNSPALGYKIRNKLKFTLRSPRITRQNSKKRFNEQDISKKHNGILPNPEEWLLAVVPDQIDSDTEFEVSIHCNIEMN